MEQSSGAGQINTAMSQLNQITQQNASSSEELAATAEQMSGHAEQLQQLMSFFTVNENGKVTTHVKVGFPPVNAMSVRSHSSHAPAVQKRRQVPEEELESIS